MKKCLYRNNFIDKNFTDLCGVNLLNELNPLVINLQNNEQIKVSENADTINGLYFSEDNKLEIPVKACKVVYDLKKSININRILISGVFDSAVDYGLANYELYISETAENLFNKENLIIEYDNSNIWQGGEYRNGCDQIFDIYDYSGRFFAIKINLSNPTDNITRICHIGLYNHELTEQKTFCEKNFGQNILRGKIPTVKGTYTADLFCLTNGTCFEKSNRIYIDSETEYTFKLDNEAVSDSFYVVGSESAIKNCCIFTSNSKDELISQNNQISYSIFPKPTSHTGVSAAIFMTDEPISFNFVAFKFSEGDFLDEVGILSYEEEMIY